MELSFQGEVRDDTVLQSHFNGAESSAHHPLPTPVLAPLPPSSFFLSYVGCSSLISSIDGKEEALPRSLSSAILSLSPSCFSSPLLGLKTVLGITLKTESLPVCNKNIFKNIQIILKDGKQMPLKEM